MMNPPCSECHAACCKQRNAPAAVMLLDHEVDYETTVADDGIGNMVRGIPYVNGKCFYLTEENRCSIYNRRPTLCQEFNCVVGYNNNGRHSFFLDDNPEVVELIELTVKRLNKEQET